jgi:hypothetical protein
LFIQSRKDIWNPTTTATPVSRSAMTGYSIIGGICSLANKLSLVEDRGFNSISVSLVRHSYFLIFLNNI